jgi:subfamily B ATP-binding cassette protein MsbA
VVPNALPRFLANIVEYLNNADAAYLFKISPLIFLFMMTVKHAAIYCHQYLMNVVSQRIIRDVRQALYSKMLWLSLDFYGKKRTGELISRVTHDVQVIENAVSYSVTDLFRQSFLIIICVGVAFSIHMKAAFIIFCVFPLLIWPISHIGKKLRKLATRSQERMADINSILLETISGARIVKAFCTENEEIQRFEEKNQDFYKIKMKTVKRLLILSPMTEIFGVICGTLIFLWLGQQVREGALSTGTFSLFLGSILRVISPVKKLGNVNAITQQALAANERIYHVLDLQPSVKESEGAKTLGLLRERIVLENLHFRYDQESDEVLRGLDLEIRTGELVAIVGPTGTGKSTLVNLIPRFYDPTSGRITFDGIDIREASFHSLRKQIGIVTQETFLFNDTVRANIAYGAPQTSQVDVESSAKKAYAHQFIMDMPDQYGTVIGDRGFRLSGGEKQRIAIARAILENPPVLILDEATSQLDSESEKFVQEALDELMRGRTVIAIAHRLSTVKKADKIVVLEKGKIVGLGKHKILLKECDLYKRLYATQFQV